MSDLISRQDTIDGINEYIEEYSEVDSDGNHSEKWCAMQEAKMTIEDMPSAQPEQRWIPCSERLPEYGENVLCYYEDDDYGVNHIIDDEDGEWFWDGVVAWRPLPEPYEERREDETD